MNARTVKILESFIDREKADIVDTWEAEEEPRNNMTLHQLFVLLSIVCFVLATVGVALPRVSFGWLGMVFLAFALFGKEFSKSP